MTDTQNLALTKLRDFTNPSGGFIDKKVAASASRKLEEAKEVISAHMERNGTGGVASAVQIMTAARIKGSEAGYLLAAGAWHDLPALLTGGGMQSHATKLRQFRRTRTVEEGPSFEWTALTALIGVPPPPAKR